MVVRVGVKGLIFFLVDFKCDFDFYEKDIIEVLLFGYYKFDELVSEKGKKLFLKV